MHFQAWLSTCILKWSYSKDTQEVPYSGKFFARANFREMPKSRSFLFSQFLFLRQPDYWPHPSLNSLFTCIRTLNFEKHGTSSRPNVVFCWGDDERLPYLQGYLRRCSWWRITLPEGGWQSGRVGHNHYIIAHFISCGANWRRQRSTGSWKDIYALE